MVLTRVKNYGFVFWLSCRFLWRDFNSVLELLGRKDELERLIRWAHRKKLRPVHEYYQRLFVDAEIRLSTQALRHPYLVGLAEWGYCAAVMLNPPPYVYPKGSATKYRLRN